MYSAQQQPAAKSQLNVPPPAISELKSEPSSQIDNNSYKADEEQYLAGWEKIMQLY